MAKASNLQDVPHIVKFEPGTYVYTKAGLDGYVRGSFKKNINGNVYVVVENDRGMIWFQHQASLYAHKSTPLLATYRGPRLLDIKKEK